MKKLTLLAVFIALFGWGYYKIFTDGPPPYVLVQLWGPNHKKGDYKVHPFKIDIKESQLEDLRERLKRELSSGRFAKPLRGIGFEYGFNTDYLQEILKYWNNTYSWRKREKLLNKYPHFQTNILGINVHFQHAKSKSKGKYKNTIPIVLIHGWPGSIVEYQKLIPLLTDPAESRYNFEVIVPSIPGYGFSEPSVVPKLETVEIANIFNHLMERIGHTNYFVAGGDWGTVISQDIAKLYPDNVFGAHLTSCASVHPKSSLKSIIVNLCPTCFFDNEILIKRNFPAASLFFYLMRESGYLHLQATKPDTIGVALSQSPSGLAAYIIEKFATWTNRTYINTRTGGLDKYPYSYDELLDNVMLYWLPNSITTSMRLYAETFKLHPNHRTDNYPVPEKVPVKCLAMPEEILNHPQWLLMDNYKNLRYEVAPRGGHFAAFEEPKLIADNIFKFLTDVIEEGRQNYLAMTQGSE